MTFWLTFFLCVKLCINGIADIKIVVNSTNGHYTVWSLQFGVWYNHEVWFGPNSMEIREHVTIVTLEGYINIPKTKKIEKLQNIPVSKPHTP